MATAGQVRYAGASPPWFFVMHMSFSLTGVESPLPCLLVAYAREAHLRLAERPITRREPMLALLLTVTAAEAVVNRLLEPLVSEEEWARLERRGASQKWVRLAAELGLAERIVEGREPLAPFMETVNARHSIVHFKHTPNLQTFEADPIEAAAGRPVFVATSGLKPVEVGPAEDALGPRRAMLYYPSFEQLARPVLDAYETKQSGVMLMIRGALDGMIRETATR